MGLEFEDIYYRFWRVICQKMEDWLHGRGFPGGSDGKESTCNAGYQRLIHGLGKSQEKGMATHSSILAGLNPWTEEPGRLQSMG